MDILEKILSDVLNYYMNAPFDLVVRNIWSKERISTIRDTQIIIYSNDHNPPHFHVKSKDNTINAKFLMSDCTLISGEIKTKDIKRIKAFHSDLKTRTVMDKIWSKKDS